MGSIMMLHFLHSQTQVIIFVVAIAQDVAVVVVAVILDDLINKKDSLTARALFMMLHFL